MKKIIDFFAKEDKFAAFCGIELYEVTDGGAKARMKIEPHHLNGAKTVHGGAIFTLADYTFAAASNSRGNLAMGINTSISYIKAATKGTLFAEAVEVACAPKLATYTVRITDDNDNVIAMFQGMVYRKKERLEEIIG